MKRTDIKFWVDFALFISICVLVITGLIMAFFTSSGPYVKEISKYFMNLHRHQWGTIHFYFAMVFSILIIIHLILEWNWIKEKTKNLLKKMWLLIPLVFSAVVIILIFWYISPKTGHYYKKNGKKWKNEINLINFKRNVEKVKSDPSKSIEKGFEEKVYVRGQVSPECKNLVITGQLSLIDLERKTGLSAKSIAGKLGLPLNIPLDERLGRLKRLYYFSMHDVRDIVISLMKKKSKINARSNNNK